MTIYICFIGLFMLFRRLGGSCNSGIFSFFTRLATSCNFFDNNPVSDKVPRVWLRGRLCLGDPGGLGYWKRPSLFSKAGEGMGEQSGVEAVEESYKIRIYIRLIKYRGNVSKILNRNTHIFRKCIRTNKIVVN